MITLLLQNQSSRCLLSLPVEEVTNLASRRLSVSPSCTSSTSHRNYSFRRGSVWSVRSAISAEGVCSHKRARAQCLSHTGSAPAHGACSLPAHTARALGCSAGNNQRPALGRPPRSKPLRFRHSGSPQRRRLGWACVLCSSQI